MPTATHPTADALTAFLLGRLADPDDAAVEGHLSACPECQGRAAATRATDPLVELVAASGRGATDAATLGWDDAATHSGGDEVPASLAGQAKYTPMRRLGAGGMGAVWLAQHAVMNRAVAVKVIRPDLLARPGATERFLREVRAVAQLHHPNIVTAFDAEPAGDSCLLVMEYVEGETLAEIVQRGPLPVAEACRAARDAARGLAHAHGLGLVHRDVKPHNLIRTADGATKVLDFGLAGVGAGGPDAASGDGMTGAGMVAGTPDYLAPEQAADAHAADARADVYGLGCTLYHLLAGRPPFPGDNVARKLHAHRTRTPDPIPGLPPRLAAVLARMLAKRPEERFQTAAEVADALEPFVASRSPARRRWVGVGLVVVGVLAVGAALAGIVPLWRVPEPASPARDFAPAPDGPGVVQALRHRVGVLVTQVAPDGRTFLACAGNEVYQYETATGDRKRLLGEFAVYAGAGRKVVTAATDGPGLRFRVYDLATGRLERTFTGGGGKLWFLGSLAGGDQVIAWDATRTVQVYDLRSGARTVSWRYEGEDVDFAVTPDGRRFLYRPAGELRYVVCDPATGVESDEFAALRDVAKLRHFAADGKTVQEGAGWDETTATIRRVSDGAAVGKPEAPPAGARRLGVSPNRTLQLFVLADGTLQVRDAVSWKLLNAVRVELPADYNRFRAAWNQAVTDDGRFAVLNTKDEDGHVVVVRFPDPPKP